MFIQLDKPIYRSGDPINFRVYSVNSETQPKNDVVATIIIYDQDSVAIQTFQDVTFTKGKYEGSLQLSTSPKYGNWLIVANVGTTVS